MELENLIQRQKPVEEVNLMPPLVWAYIGDSVYEMFIRMHFINTTKLNPHKLHIETIKYVKAKAQADTLFKLKEKNVFTEEENDIIRRGRNAQNHHLPKNADLSEYQHATAFEALLGYLYLTKQDERLQYILEKTMEVENLASISSKNKN